MTKNDLVLAMGEIKDEYIEKSEEMTGRKRPGKLKSIILAAAMILAFSVTACAAVSFFSTISGGEITFVEAVGEYTGDVYRITFDIEVAEDAEYKINDYYVPMYLEKNWVDCGGEAGETYSALVYDNYDENWYAIFQQHPAFYHKEDMNGSFVYNVPAGTEFSETCFEIDGEKLFCVETQPHDDGFRGDPFGTRILFWSDGYYFFVLETRLTMDDEILREIVRSVRKVRDISDCVIYKEYEE